MAGRSVGDGKYRPLLGIDDVAGLEERLGTARPGLAGLLRGASLTEFQEGPGSQILDTPDPEARLLIVAELQVAVLAPVERVGSGVHGLAGLPEVAGGVVGGLVVPGDVVPHAVLDEDVGRHVARVRHGRRDLREAVRSLKRQGGMKRIVEGVNDVVDRPGW